MQREIGMKTVVTLAGLVVVIAGLRASGGFFLPVLAGLFIVVVSTPMLQWLGQRRVPNVLAILLTVLVDVLVLAALVALVGSSFSGFNEALPRYQHALGDLAVGSMQFARARGIPDAQIEAITDTSWIFTMVTEVLRELTSIVSNAFLVVVLVVFMMFELAPGRAKLAILLGGPHEHVEKLAEAAEKVQRYLVVKTWLSAVTAVLFGVWLWLVGVDFPLLWGLLAFLLNFIPTIGPAIATVPPVLVALLTLGPGAALAATIGCLAANIVIGNVFEPRMMGEALGLSTLVVFMSMLFWGWLWGPVGALLAVPLTMLLRSALEIGEDTRWLAVMLGSTDWVERKRREWGWLTREERQSASGQVEAPSLEGDVE